MAHSTARRTPKTFRKWARQVPEGFVFSLKGPRYAINRRVLKEAGKSIKRFLESGMTELGDKLGPLLWQFAPTQEIRRSRLRRFPRTAAGDVQRPHAAPCGRGSPRQLQDAGVHRAVAQIPGRGRASPITTPTPRSPTSPAISSMRGCRRARTKSRPPIRRRRSTPGPSGSTPGQRGKSRPTCRVSSQTQAEGRAARCICLCDPRGQGAGAGGRDGADRAIEGLSRGDSETKAQSQGGEIQIREIQTRTKLFTIGYEKSKPDA